MSQRLIDILKTFSIIGLTLMLASCGKPASKDQAPAAQSQAAAPQNEIAGEIFGVPVPVGNYYFAKRVHSMVQTPEEKAMTPEQMEKNIWHNLTLSLEASRKGIEVTQEEFDQWVDSVLEALQLPFKRTTDPDKYKAWVTDTVKESVELFENQMRYLATIEKLKREIIKEMQVTVSDEEMREDWLNVQNHVGGEFVLFDTKAEADKFYGEHKDPKAWEDYKAANPDKVRKFQPMTVQAIIDLWGVPKDQINAFHALPEGTVGEPLPFGTQTGVFRLMEKRSGDIAKATDKELEQSKQRVEARKKYQASLDWLEAIDERANIKVYVKDEAPKA